MNSTASSSPETKEQRRARIEQRLQEARARRPQPVPPNPPPRYDEVFFRGREWLDRLANEPDCCADIEP
jgi:hypothetical protein